MSGQKLLMIGPFISMEVLCDLCVAIGIWHNTILGGAIRGKWRIPDGNDESGLFSCSELRRW
jgi:hypothetical protein